MGVDGDVERDGIGMFAEHHAQRIMKECLAEKTVIYNVFWILHIQQVSPGRLQDDPKGRLGDASETPVGYVISRIHSNLHCFGGWASMMMLCVMQLECLQNITRNTS